MFSYIGHSRSLRKRLERRNRNTNDKINGIQRKRKKSSKQTNELDLKWVNVSLKQFVFDDEVSEHKMDVFSLEDQRKVRMYLFTEILILTKNAGCIISKIL